MVENVNPRLVRSYDLRGVVGRELTGADAFALGLRVAAVCGRGRVGVGYDGRLSSPALEAALVEGLVAGGARAERVGMGPTGLLYFAVHEHDLDGGVMVTGSHNPADQNGFKILVGREPVYGAALRALVEAPAVRAAGGDARSLAVSDAYVARLARAAAGMPALRVGWDPGHGAAGAVLPALLARLPGEHRMIHAEVDGRFPGHHPDPSEPENLRDLQRLVMDEGLDLGIAFDGDGDRIGMVSGAGAIVWADQLTLFLARNVLRRHPGAAIVADVKSSRVLFDGIAAAGGRAVMAPSGYVLVREAMLRENAPFAGEMSGHIFFREDWHGTDDALHVAMRVLRAGDLNGFHADLPRTFATPELRLHCPDARKAAVLAAVGAGAEGAVDRTDGLRVSEADGWWLLRASGTEPKLTARVEAWTEAGRARMVQALRRRLAAEGVELP